MLTVTGYWARVENKLNVIEVDWSKDSNNFAYCPSARRVPSVGETIAKFIEFNREHINLDKLIIVGHSLGAHVAGYGVHFNNDQISLKSKKKPINFSYLIYSWEIFTKKI